jgi:uncharacterized protein (TIGR04255 family)
MNATDLHPKFHFPPVEEVAVGVQFDAPGFLPTHLGGFHERVKANFPGVQPAPPLPPAREEFAAPPVATGNAPFPFPMFTVPVLVPRVFFISRDDCSLIQLQGDRLYFNWRRRPHKTEYPHYDHVRAEFAKVYREFVAFAADQGFGPIMPNQCDVLYVNPLPANATGVEPSSPESAFRVWSSDVGDEWQESLEDLSFNARYRFVDEAGKPFGRLTVTMSTGVISNDVPQMRLELTARGAPRGSSVDDILAFHDLGHDAIVRCFAAITTPAMHGLWGRYQ